MYKQKLIINKTIDKKEIQKLINWFINNFGAIKTTKLLDKLKLLGFNYATKIGISLGIKDLKIPKIKKTLIKNNQKNIDKLYYQIKKGNLKTIEYDEKVKEKWNQISEILKKEINDNFRTTDLLNPLYVMVISGARGNISQIKQLVGMRGLMVDPKGEIINIPIKSNLKESLNIVEYFISCYGARKGVIDTAIKTATAGHLTRKLIYLVQDQIIRRPDCYTKEMEIVFNLKNKKSYYNKSIEKILGRVAAKEIRCSNLTISSGQDICNYLAKKIIHIKKIFLRTPLTCKVNHGICQLCYGWNLANNRIADLGEPVGILAAQSIGEPGTQLTMRTFHTGGIFSGEIGETLTSPINGTIYYENKKDKKLIKLNNNSKVLLTLKEKKLLIIENKQKRFNIKLPKHSLIFIKSQKKVFEKQIISEIINWKKAKKLIKTKNNKERLKGVNTSISGKFIILKKNYLHDKEKQQKLCITNANIITKNLMKHNLENKTIYHIKQKIIHKINICSNFEPMKNLFKISEKDKKKNSNKLKILKIINARKKKKLNIKLRSFTLKKSKCKNNLITEKTKTNKIIKKKKDNRNFEKIKKNYEANEKKLYIDKNYCSEVIENRKKTISLNKAILYQIKQKNLILDKNKGLVKKDSIIFYTQYKTQKTTDIVQGLPKIEEILENKKSKQQKILKSLFEKIKENNTSKIAAKKSIYKIQNYLVKKIQLVYLSQGIIISNKHIEVIIRKITSKAIIRESGESSLMQGEIVEINKLEKINKKLQRKITYEPVIIGISKSSLLNNSLISNICFRGVIENLTIGAIEGKVDWLNGIKENIIIGNLIPAGTGQKIP
uniref:DNA-directed RNA polymerase n=1 Tax=Trachelomonas volvocina TaxID=103340 RepID=A0A0G3VP57_9EUGL|nr:RNA polymerase beta'' subunit [Trachelomonas volvocina]AKL82456.1 RNA polymerase beta'' subunit [Trachelomonas volvocina]